jgi:hypothetical protein
MARSHDDRDGSTPPQSMGFTVPRNHEGESGIAQVKRRDHAGHGDAIEMAVHNRRGMVVHGLRRVPRVVCDAPRSARHGPAYPGKSDTKRPGKVAPSRPNRLYTRN